MYQPSWISKILPQHRQTACSKPTGPGHCATNNPNADYLRASALFTSLAYPSSRGPAPCLSSEVGSAKKKRSSRLTCACALSLRLGQRQPSPNLLQPLSSPPPQGGLLASFPPPPSSLKVGIFRLLLVLLDLSASLWLLFRCCCKEDYVRGGGGGSGRVGLCQATTSAWIDTSAATPSAAAPKWSTASRPPT